ncbi:MAG: hypothetical protein J6N93_07485, partial [Clostridia bacterium]|nr:hypothetical protein [Clostridia bacterium]
ETRLKVDSRKNAAQINAVIAPNFNMDNTILNIVFFLDETNERSTLSLSCIATSVKSPFT